MVQLQMVQEEMVQLNRHQEDKSDVQESRDIRGMESVFYLVSTDKVRYLGKPGELSEMQSLF